ncbi:hypothetical protein MPER_12173, partial [Moniliophthora perniciosa FA553]
FSPMKLTLNIVRVTLAITVATARLANPLPVTRSPHDEIDWSKHQYQAPQEGDARGPYPGLNTYATFHSQLLPCSRINNSLANHGFLARNGMNITIPAVLQGSFGTENFLTSHGHSLIRCVDGFNLPTKELLFAAKASVFTSDLLDQFSLNDIKLHGNIEHDASLSRVDHALGDNTIFNSLIYATLASSNPGADYYNGTSACQVPKERLAHLLANNPQRDEHNQGVFD